MELDRSEAAVLQRFRDKTASAGGPRAGYMLRRGAITYHAARAPELDFDGALSGLVARDLLKVSESGELYYLTEAGVAALAES